MSHKKAIAGRGQIMGAKDMTKAELDALETTIHRSTSYDYGNDGKLRAIGGYLSTRPDISLSVESLREMGQKRLNLPFQAIPFGIADDAEAIAAAWNAMPDLLALAKEALELREALEYATADFVSLYSSANGQYCCVLFEGGADAEECYCGATPLEAIQNARRGA